MKHVENITLRQTQPLDRSQTDKPYIDKTGPDRHPLTGHRQVNHILTRQDKTDNPLTGHRQINHILTRQDKTDNLLTGHRQINHRLPRQVIRQTSP